MKLNYMWLNGKYANGEINTDMPYVAVNEPDFFAAGDDAEQIIKEILNYYNLAGDATEEDAFNWWVNTFLCD